MKQTRQEPDFLRFSSEMQAGKQHPVYIFYGEEDFLMEEAEKALQRQLSGQDDGVDMSRVEGASSLLDDVLDMVDTVSLFGGSRFVVVTNAPYFTKEHAKSESLDRLLAHATRLQADSCVVFLAVDVTKTLKAYKELTAKGMVYRFDSLKPYAISAWVRQKITAAGKTVSADVLDLFVERVGKDLRRLNSEVDKLVTYLGDKRELDETTVLHAASRSIHGDIFALTEAVVYGKSAKAMGLLQDLFAAGEPPLRILAMLVRQFRLLGEACEQMRRGCSKDELAARLGLHPYAAQKLAAQVEKTNEDRLYRAVELLLQADLDMKRGRIDHVLAMETLVVALGEKSA